MSSGPRLVLLGKQGAGKGTQAARLADHFGITHLATGDLLRAAVAAGTEVGRAAQRYMDTGELVPDEIVFRVVEENVTGDELTDGFVLDGFPRTESQAIELERVLDGRPLDLVINLDVSTAIVLDRIAGRRVCESCGAPYHVNMPPERDWTCDTCGGHVVQRSDDTEEAVMRRLELYEQETVPIIAFYRRLGKLEVVDGEGEGDEVFKRLVSTIERHCART
ncbi:MAG TPA: adenylate kinase [Acidimicrobiia bacterium]